MKDSYGKGLLDFWHGNKDALFLVESDIAETEEWPVSIFFRDYADMPELEKTALESVNGTILDIGAGAGSHAFYLQEKGYIVTAMDISAGAVEVMRERGIKKVVQQNFFDYTGEKFDTILMLMNGIGISGRLKNLPDFFRQSENLLAPEGKIILDSSDISFLFDEEDEELLQEMGKEYYGELQYTFQYGDDKDEPFDWLFVDFDTLCYYADKAGFTCRKLYEDEHFLYLAELKRKN